MDKKVVISPLVWKKNKIVFIDQTRLPLVLKYETCRCARDVWWAIKKLQVRGAPLIGIAGAYGFLLGMQKAKASTFLRLRQEARKLSRYLASSRPTAVNLVWALERMQTVVQAARGSSKKEILTFLAQEARTIMREDVDMCFRMGAFGQKLIRSGQRLLTVCNAGALATSGYGTALGVFYRARQEGKRFKVYACETRPLLQGARLTTWELKRNGIDVTLLCDNMAADLMRRRRLDAVFVGADRIASNGDFANKIGTYSLAVCAHYHKIPFYCVAPFSTFDLSLKSGRGIPIEERAAEEVTSLAFKRPMAPSGVRVYNPAFDVTPAALVTAIITEKGIIRRPFKERIRAFYGR